MLGKRVFFLKAAFAIAALDLISQTAHLIHLKASAKERFNYCRYLYALLLQHVST